MPKVRFDPDKWSARAGAAGSEYNSGVLNPRASQSASAIAAKDVYASAVQAAIGRGAFEKGLQKAGDAKWQKGVAEKGRARFTQGVMVGKDNYRTGFQPYANVIQGITLAPRGPKGQNYGRVQQIGDALRAAKEAA